MILSFLLQTHVHMSIYSKESKNTKAQIKRHFKKNLELVVIVTFIAKLLLLRLSSTQTHQLIAILKLCEICYQL